MALLNTTFNPAEQNDIYKQDFDLLPAGNYNVIITNTEEKVTRDGTGTRLVIEMEVQSGEFQGRKIWDSINIQNQNDKTVAAGQRKIKQIMFCLDMVQVKDSSEFHFKPLIAVVEIRKSRNEYPDSNGVKRFEKAIGAHSAQPPAQQRGFSRGGSEPWSAGR